MHYASGSEDDVKKPSASARPAEQTASDSGSDEDGSEAELHMGGTAPGESDVEVELELFDPNIENVTPLSPSF